MVYRSRYSTDFGSPQIASPVVSACSKVPVIPQIFEGLDLLKDANSGPTALKRVPFWKSMLKGTYIYIYIYRCRYGYRFIMWVVVKIMVPFLGP